MAKRKQPALPVALDDVMARVTSAVEGKLLKVGAPVAHNPSVVVLPMPAFSCRYLLQNEGLPLSCVYQIVGPEASYKSTFAAEVLRWHRLCGGFGLLSEAETKPTPDMRNAVLNYDVKAVKVLDCESMDDWQRHAAWYTEELKAGLSKEGSPGRTIPWCHIVDTLTGKVTTTTLKKITTTGVAGLHHPVEAKSIADFMRAHPQRLLGWPFTFVGVNHLKLARDETGAIEKNVPGGWALKFQCAAIIEMERLGQIKEFRDYNAATIRMQTIKNSYGRDNIRIHVGFKTWHQEDAPGVHRLHSRFEWWASSILLIAKGLGMTTVQSDKYVPLMQEACDVHEKACGSRGKLYWSNALGVPSSDPVSAHELGVLLEQHPDVLGQLYDVTGVRRQPFFKPGVDYMQTIEGYDYVEAQARAADEYQVRAAELAQQQINIGMTTMIVPAPAEVDVDSDVLDTGPGDEL